MKLNTIHLSNKGSIHGRITNCNEYYLGDKILALHKPN